MIFLKLRSIINVTKIKSHPVGMREKRKRLLHHELLNYFYIEIRGIINVTKIKSHPVGMREKRKRLLHHELLNYCYIEIRGIIRIKEYPCDVRDLRFLFYQHLL